MAGEKERIENAGGRVEAYTDYNGEPVGPVRVWFRTEDSPGLAMSRSLGDENAKSIGVSSEPDVRFYKRDYY